MEGDAFLISALRVNLFSFTLNLTEVAPFKFFSTIRCGYILWPIPSAMPQFFINQKVLNWEKP